DVTELRRLEVIRRDFVANVSHELRTPLTAIKGYAETLLGGAGDNPETRGRFLSVIDRHSERLGRLIDDLLALSDLELGRRPPRDGAVLPRGQGAVAGTRWHGPRTRDRQAHRPGPWRRAGNREQGRARDHGERLPARRLQRPPHRPQPQHPPFAFNPPPIG